MTFHERLFIIHRSRYVIYLAKYLSLMLSGTFTPDTSILVVVATKNLWLTLEKNDSVMAVEGGECGKVLHGNIVSVILDLLSLTGGSGG